MIKNAFRFWRLRINHNTTLIQLAKCDFNHFYQVFFIYRTMRGNKYFDHWDYTQIKLKALLEYMSMWWDCWERSILYQNKMAIAINRPPGTSQHQNQPSAEATGMFDLNARLQFGSLSCSICISYTSFEGSWWEYFQYASFRSSLRWCVTVCNVI